MRACAEQQPQQEETPPIRAIGIRKYLPISDEASLLDLEIPKPEVGGRDLLIAVRAIAVNPVDAKVRAPKSQVENPPRILGWDAAGVVEVVGPDVTLFSPRDEVFYAGSITRPGHVVAAHNLRQGSALQRSDSRLGELVDRRFP